MTGGLGTGQTGEGEAERETERKKERGREGGVYTFALYHLLSWLGSFFFFCNTFQNDTLLPTNFSVCRPIVGSNSSHLLGCISDLSLGKFDIDFLQIRASYVRRERKAKNRLHGRRQTRRTNFHPSICSRGELKIRRNSFTYRDDSRDLWQRRNTNGSKTR